jgi:gas vesicle protein
MPKVYKVNKARKAQPEHGIEVGDTYYHWYHRVGMSSLKRVSKTYPKRSQLTLSPFLGQLYDLEDAGWDSSDPGEGTVRERAEKVKDAAIERLEQIESEMEDLRDMAQESLDNMPDNLRDSSASGELLQSRVDGCEGCQSEASNVKDTVESRFMDFESTMDDLEGETNEDEDVTDEEFQEDVEQRMEEALSDFISDVESELENLDLSDAAGY